MANVRAALYRDCRTSSGWRRFRINPVRKGRGWHERIEVPDGLTTEFLDVIKKKFADEIKEVDLLRFCVALRKRGCEARTVSNYYSARANKTPPSDQAIFISPELVA